MNFVIYKSGTTTFGATTVTLGHGPSLVVATGTAVQIQESRAA